VEQARLAAEQATTAAADVSQRMRNLNVSETLQSLQGTGTGGAPQEGPSDEELREYGIDTDFREYLRSLTYSTFRRATDFPLLGGDRGSMLQLVLLMHNEKG
jgi:hypothetical protein